MLKTALSSQTGVRLPAQLTGFWVHSLPVEQ